MLLTIQYGTLNGKGIFYDENGNIYYEGDVKDDKPHGKGIEYDDNGVKLYEGDVKDGERHGTGVVLSLIHI